MICLLGVPLTPRSLLLARESRTMPLEGGGEGLPGRDPDLDVAGLPGGPASALDESQALAPDGGAEELARVKQLHR